MCRRKRAVKAAKGRMSFMGKVKERTERITSNWSIILAACFFLLSLF